MNESSSASAQDQLEQLAGEYVLGTLPAEERRALEARLPHDPPLQAAVQAWEARLLPLTALAEPVTPSPQLWWRIARSLTLWSEPAPAAAPAPAPQPLSAWSRLWASLPLWRGLSAAGLACAALLAVVISTGSAPTPLTPQFVVVLAAPQTQNAGWIVQASDTQSVELIPLATFTVPADQALEFWTKADHWQAPVSLGLVKPGQPLRIPLEHLPPLQNNQLFELTLEPATGSPTGLPTGPIQFIGRAVRVPT